MNTRVNNLAAFLIRQGDDRLILGHRLSEWCGHGPMLEEDIALANVALDLIGQATNFLAAAAKEQNTGGSADSLAFLRTEIEYTNLILVEQPNGDFASTMARQFLFDAWSVPFLTVLQSSKNEVIAGLAAKSLKEDLYHLRHSRSWVVRLGDGTTESKARIQQALNDLWRFSGEAFIEDPTVTALVADGTIPSLKDVKLEWSKIIDQTFAEATLTRPKDPATFASGGRWGRHSEHLGHLLSEMQILPRTYPNAQW